MLGNTPAALATAWVYPPLLQLTWPCNVSFTSNLLNSLQHQACVWNLSHCLVCLWGVLCNWCLSRRGTELFTPFEMPWWLPGIWDVLVAASLWRVWEFVSICTRTLEEVADKPRVWAASLCLSVCLYIVLDKTDWKSLTSCGHHEKLESWQLYMKAKSSRLATSLHYYKTNSSNSEIWLDEACCDGAFKPCLKDCIYELNAHECHQKVNGFIN